MAEYQFRQHPGIDAGGLSAQIIGEALANIEDRHGVIDPHTVVDESRPEDAPLHPVFEWRDEVAAEKWRLEQARRVVRSVEIVVDRHPESTQIAYVNIQSQGGYVSAAAIRSQPDLYQEALLSYRSRLDAASVQLAKLEDLAPPSERSRIRKDRRTLERLAAV